MGNFQNDPEEKRHGKKKNSTCYQYDVYFVNDNQNHRNRFCKNRPDMDWRKYIT